MGELQFSDKFSDTQKSSSIIVNQTYSYINNTGFYALANPTYYDYYYRFARRYAWWYDRYVPDFHNAQQGYFSTGIAHAIVDGIANLIVGRKLLLQNSGNILDKTVANDSLKKAYKWAEKTRLTSKIRTLTKYGGAIGTSLLKANISRGDVWLEALRFDDFFFKTDFKGDLREVSCLIKSYTNTMPKTVKWAEDKGNDLAERLENKFYLVEHRYFKELTEEVNGHIVKHDVPFVKYQIHRYNGNITNAQTWNMSLQETVRFDSIPTEVRKSIAKDYSTLMFDKEERLPFFEHLGCVLFKYNDADGSLSQQPFGESILTNILTDLMNYDLTTSYAIRDMYQGKGIIFMAKELQTAFSGINTFSGLEDSLVTLLNNWNADSKIPMQQVQFNLRVEEWRAKLNSIYETIAMKLAISPSSLASFLTDNSARTAKEVSTETSATDSYIEIQRGCLATPINELLKVIGNYYGWLDDIEIRFGKNGSNDIDTIIDRAIKLTNARLMTPYQAIKMFMVDADETEIEEAYEKVKTYYDEQDKKQQDMSFGMDFDTKIGGQGYANEEK